MKRELKDDIVTVDDSNFHPNRKAHPDEKGTESCGDPRLACRVT